MPGAKAIPAFHAKLHAWYGAHGRKSLPWRTTRDAYKIYLSEVMLQQTQVKTVLDRYYFQFLEKFPTLQALAAAPQHEVLKAWQGLGYYNRAVNLHRAAKACASALPDSVEALVALPGVGQNTAHAVAAFAYHQPVPVMEANVKRVLCRIFALEEANPKTLWEKAALLLDRKNPFDYNQAMMDIGAMVCTRRKPACGICPASAICKGKTNPESYPAAKTKKQVPTRKRIIIVKENSGGQIHATARSGKFLNGLYGFLEGEKKPAAGKYIGEVRQQYSHFTLQADIYLQSARGKGKGWYSLKQFHALPHSGAEAKILKLLEKIRA